MSKNVYQLIAEVSAEIARDGISKSRKNQQQGYAFRGIDDVYNALAPVIASRGLVILPRVLSRELTERASAKGGILFSVVVEAEFDFVSSHDGSKHTVKTYGEAMDSADKATNKAMSAAYKYAAFQTFCIPTEGDNDADAACITNVIKRGQDLDITNYEEQHLPVLRDAALSGPDALAAAFSAIEKSPEKAAFWTAHGASLKAAAQKAIK